MRREGQTRVAARDPEPTVRSRELWLGPGVYFVFVPSDPHKEVKAFGGALWPFEGPAPTPRPSAAGRG